MPHYLIDVNEVGAPYEPAATPGAALPALMNDAWVATPCSCRILHNHDFDLEVFDDDRAEQLQVPDSYVEPAELLNSYFTYAHLTDAARREASAQCAELADYVMDQIPPGPERTAGMRKLMEAKDCFVRAALPVEVD